MTGVHLLVVSMRSSAAAFAASCMAMLASSGAFLAPSLNLVKHRPASRLQPAAGGRVSRRATTRYAITIEAVGSKTEYGAPEGRCSLCGEVVCEL